MIDETANIPEKRNRLVKPYFYFDSATIISLPYVFSLTIS